jgi:hypothetical protein
MNWSECKSFLLTSGRITCIKKSMGLLYNPLPAQATFFGAAPSSLSSILGPSLGLDTSGNFALSITGQGVGRAQLAILNGNRYFTALIDDEGEQLLDATSLVTTGVNPCVYRIPVSVPSRGDLILISDCPFSVRYVLGAGEGPEPRIFGLDPVTGDVAELIPASNPFIGCFYIKIVSLYGMAPGSLGFGGRFYAGEAEFQEGPMDIHEAGDGKREEGIMGERSELNLLLLSMLLNQQQCAAPCASPTTVPVAPPAPPPCQPVSACCTAPNLTALLPLLLVGGGPRGLGLLELVMLMSAMQPSTTGQVGLQSNGLALMLLLLGMGGEREAGFFRRPWGPGAGRTPWGPPEAPPASGGSAASPENLQK